jgi:Transposase
MGQASTIGLDIAKRVFQAHGADASGHVVFRKRLVRAKLLEFFAAQLPCIVAMEACAGAHHWAREIGKLGHTARLIPPAYVKPFVKRQKNDAPDAEAICEAAQRPSMRFVAVKSEGQQACRCCDGAHRGPGLLRAGECARNPDGAGRHLPGAGGANPSAGCRDHPARESRPGRTPAHDDPRHRPDCGHRDYDPRAGTGGLPRRTRLRGLARADAAAEIDRQQAEARSELKDG